MSESVGVEDVSRSVKQLIRYGLVGFASNLFGYAVYLFITYLGVDPKVTVTLLYPVGVAIGFLGNQKWAFGYKGNWLKSGVRYAIAHVFGYLINLFILLIFVDRLGYSHQWVQAVAIVVVAGFLFLVFRYFVFPKTEGCH